MKRQKTVHLTLYRILKIQQSNPAQKPDWWKHDCLGWAIHAQYVNPKEIGWIIIYKSISKVFHILIKIQMECWHLFLWIVSNNTKRSSQSSIEIHISKRIVEWKSKIECAIEKWKGKHTVLREETCVMLWTRLMSD